MQSALSLKSACVARHWVLLWRPTLLLPSQAFRTALRLQIAGLFCPVDAGALPAKATFMRDDDLPLALIGLAKRDHSTCGPLLAHPGVAIPDKARGCRHQCDYDRRGAALTRFSPEIISLDS